MRSKKKAARPAQHQKQEPGREHHCRKAVDEVVREFGHLEVLVNNAAEQHPQEELRGWGRFFM